MSKPILKWVGGKTQILNKIGEKLPETCNNYRELFIGGGSVLIYILSSSLKIEGKVYAYDINEGLIGLYKNVQHNPEQLYNCLQEISINEEEYYYTIRKKFNQMTDKTSILYSAYFLFLNKTCFRGLYREGPNGFNVPYGHYKNPEIINKNNLMSLSKLFKNVEFICCDFEKVFENIEPNDFLYLDPPYAKENNKSFTEYLKNSFSAEKQNILFSNILNLNNSKFLLSNSNTPLVKSRFSSFNIREIEAKRSINSKNPNSKTIELLIDNY